jgi:acyl carrier protein
MTREEVSARTRAAVARALRVGPETITEATRAADVPGWDSLAHLVALSAVEKALGVKLPTLQAYATQDLGGIVDLATAAVARKRGN